jgi:uncharacterized repeat protein (TIGR03803 family)
VVQGSDGSFYGSTFEGGTNGDGVLFKLSMPSCSIPIDAAFGFSNGLFGFDVSAPVGSNVVVQASADFQHWTPLQTNLVGSSGLFYFTNSQSSINSQRFYRAAFYSFISR